MRIKAKIIKYISNDIFGQCAVSDSPSSCVVVMWINAVVAVAVTKSGL